jgi:ketopantoate reductase
LKNSTKQPLVIVGIGEMGSIFARGFLRLGHPVYPVTRTTSMATIAAEMPRPELVLVAVAEGDLHPVLEALPVTWRGRLGLLQNELLPGDWENLGLPTPTVITVWLEKKAGKDHRVIVPSPVFGPRADLLAAALVTLDVPTRVLAEPDELLFELVVKNLYILTTNIAGLHVGGNVGELWADHQALARRIAEDVIDLEEALTGRRFDQDALIKAMVRAFQGDPTHVCMGRRAQARLARALAQGEQYGLDLPALRQFHTALA